MSATTGTQVELLFSSGTAVTKNTFSTEAVITGVTSTNTLCNLPAGWLFNNNPNPLNRVVMYECYGTVANTGAATLAINIGFDPTANNKANPITVNAATAPTAAVTSAFYVKALYTCTAFSNAASNPQATFQVNGMINWASNGGAMVSQWGGFQGTITNFNSSVVNYIELFGTWSASSASNTTTIQQQYLWGLN